MLYRLFVAFAIADCSIDEDAQMCRNTYFHIDMQVQLCRGPQNQSMCRCSCVQISISQRGRTEETAHAFQSTEHLVHLFLSFHFGFLKNVEVNFRKLNILFPFARVASKSTEHLSLLFISNPRYLQKTYLLAAKRQKIETWALCTVLHLHRGGLIQCVETFWI